MTKIEELYLVKNQVHILYSQSLVTFLFPLLFAAVIYYLLVDIASKNTLVIWVGTVVIFSIIRYLLLWLYNKNTKTSDNIHLWLWLFVITAFLSGAIWGIAPTIILPYQPDNIFEYTLHNSLILLIICGLVAGAGITYSVNLLVMYAYTLPILLLPCVHLILLGDEFNSTLGIFLFIYFIFVNITVVRLNKQFAHYLRVEYKYEQLLAQIQNQDMNKVNSTKSEQQ